MNTQFHMENGATTEISAKKPSLIRRLYNWVLKWADSPWGGTALFILAVVESIFFPIPPDVLLIALCLGSTKKSFRYATICLAGTLTGAVIAYALGHWAWNAVDHWFIPSVFSQSEFDSVGAIYDKWNFWAVFTAGFTPIPYKIFTITAGVFNINFSMFMLASLIGRGMRFFFVGWLIWKFGSPIKSFIDKYLNLLAILFTVLLIGCFLLIRYVI